MVYSLEGPVSIYNNDNFKASALPSLILYLIGMSEFQNWLNMVGACKKYGCLIVSECMQLLFISCEK